MDKPMSRKGHTHLADAVLESLVSIGEDGKGKGGLVGYFRRLARQRPRDMVSLISEAQLLSSTERNPEEKITKKWTKEELSKLSLLEISELYRADLAAGRAPNDEGAIG
jgi:hypothetical protein